MSAIDGFSSSGAPASSTNAFQDLTTESFLEIIFTELTNQDPLAPNETKDLLEQISLIRSIESDASLASQIESVVARNEFASAGALLGTFVTGLSEFGEPAEGVVGSVSVTADGPILNLLTGARVPFDQVFEVLDTSVLAAALADDGDTTPDDGASGG